MSSIAGIASAADSSVRYPHSIVYRVQMDAPHVRLSRLPLPPGVRIKEVRRLVLCSRLVIHESF